MRSTQRKGDIAVTQAVATFTLLGYDVALPVTESAPYDILVDCGDGIFRVQVRYSSTVDVELRRIHSNSHGYVVKKMVGQKYDWLYVLMSDGKEYLIKKCYEGRRSVRPTEDHLIKNHR